MADVPLDVLPEGLDLEGDVRFGRHDRMLYATDASIYQVEPLGVVLPRHAEDARRAVAWCAARGLPVLPRGGGTALAGQTVGRAVVLDFSRYCRAVTGLDPTRRRAVVEPGLVLDDLNRAAAPHGLVFGPDVATATHATLGGMIGNNSAGAHSILYGRTVEHVESVDLLLADGTPVTLGPASAGGDARAATLAEGVASIVRPLAGEIRARYPRTTRRANGYNLDLMLDGLEGGDLNLAQLVCGSEGTLGVVTGATVRLVERPACTGLAITALRDVDEALSLVVPVLETRPAAVELIDDVIIRLARGNVECRRHVDLLPGGGDAATGAVLYVEYFADGPEALEERFEALRARLGDRPLAVYTAPAAMARAWALRRAGEPLLHAVPGDRKPLTFIEDTAVDPSRLAAFVRDFRAIVAAHGTTAACYAHASVGCLHIRPMIAPRDPAGRAAMEAIAAEVTDLVRAYGGALSGEHGDGRARSALLERFYGRRICDAFGAIKTLFDPEGRMNPGNIVDPGPITAALRVRPGEATVRRPEVETFFRYDREGGFGSAVEMCNGAGVCRKTSGGTMCPSYRALLDERHSTRGRGNALRLAVTGQLEGLWDDAETIETLDLCLSCKACKAECPSNVDVAKLKAEYTAQRYEAAGRVPWRVRAFGRVRPAFRLASALHPAADRLGRFPPTAALVRAVLGIDRRRSLPRFARVLAAPRPRPGPPVVLVPDCFTLYSEPHVGRAAVELLEAFGYRVVLPEAGCCGRPLISAGVLGEARGVCRATAWALARVAREQGAVAVVGVEPSCVSAITDDWPDLVGGPDVAYLAGMTSLVEQFLDERWEDHPSWPAWRTASRGVLLHGDCHQKALWGVESSAGLLARLAGDRLRVLETGCCGMAGGFGYTRYDLSMAIGELELFPAVRREPAAEIAAPGTSCRHQLRDGVGRVASHPVEIARRLLV